MDSDDPRPGADNLHLGVPPGNERDPRSSGRIVYPFVDAACASGEWGPAGLETECILAPV